MKELINVNNNDMKIILCIYLDFLVILSAQQTLICSNSTIEAVEDTWVSSTHGPRENSYSELKWTKKLQHIMLIFLFCL